jgi:hypothetical protein
LDPFKLAQSPRRAVTFQSYIHLYSRFEAFFIQP